LVVVVVGGAGFFPFGTEVVEDAFCGGEAAEDVAHGDVEREEDEVIVPVDDFVEAESYKDSKEKDG
jgi:hypothetical protein